MLSRLRLATLTVLVLTLAVVTGCSVDGTPSRSTAAADQVVGLANTVWAGTDSNGDDYVFEYLPGGALRYTSPTGTWTAASWEQDGASVYMQMNDRYAEYHGTIAGDRITGTARNVTGKEWTWSLVRQ